MICIVHLVYKALENIFKKGTSLFYRTQNVTDKCLFFQTNIQNILLTIIHNQPMQQFLAFEIWEQSNAFNSHSKMIFYLTSRLLALSLQL